MKRKKKSERKRRKHGCSNSSNTGVVVSGCIDQETNTLDNNIINKVSNVIESALNIKRKKRNKEHVKTNTCGSIQDGTLCYVCKKSFTWRDNVVNVGNNIYRHKKCKPGSHAWDKSEIGQQSKYVFVKDKHEKVTTDSCEGEE